MRPFEVPNISRIAVLGTARQEVYLVDRDDLGDSFAPGSQIDIDQAGFTVGGSGANVAVALSRAGHEAIFLGNLAHDVAGESVLGCFDTENVDTSYVSYPRGATACDVILLDSRTGRSSVLDYRGVSRRVANLDAEDLDTIQPDWLYAGPLAGDMDKLLEFFEKAHSIGAKIMWNPGPDELRHTKKLIGLLSDTDILIVNKEEAAAIVPGVILTELLSRLSNYCQTVIITDGEMGAIAASNGQSFRLGIYEQGTVRDLRGAGDAFAGSFLAEYLKSSDLRESLIFAAASAAHVTQNYGTMTGLLTGSERLHPMPIVEIKDLDSWTNEVKSEVKSKKEKK